MNPAIALPLGLLTLVGAGYGFYMKRYGPAIFCAFWAGWNLAWFFSKVTQ